MPLVNVNGTYSASASYLFIRGAGYLLAYQIFHPNANTEPITVIFYDNSDAASGTIIHKVHIPHGVRPYYVRFARQHNKDDGIHFNNGIFVSTGGAGVSVWATAIDDD